MKVLLTVPSLGREFGGPVEVASGLQGALEELGHDVTVVGAGQAKRPGAVALRSPFRFHGTPVTFAGREVGRSVERADVVHILGYRDPVGTIASWAARRRGVPYVLEPTGMHRRRLRSIGLKAVFDATLGRSVVSGARLVVATSRSEAAELTSDGLPRHRVTVRPNGIDLQALEPLPPRGALRARLGLDLEVSLVLSLGRLTRKKGLPSLVQAVAGIPGAHLVIIGPDDRDGTVEAIQRTRAELRIGDRVHLLPDGLWGAERAQALVDADVFCLFSMTENFGVAPAEAAACGTATVVSDRCGVAEWLGDGAAVVPYGDVMALRDTIAALLRDRGRRCALAKRGRVAARALSWESVARQQLALYQRALGPA